jgi:MoaA/NifB/PqqE/SkfB family radical SAM enzyme
LSGAEATLRADLPAIARRARSEGRFAHVRLQTNGRRLANRAYLDELIEAGIDEYFISVHAGTADLDAVLTRNPRSFFEMRNGLANCIAAGVRTISNTCVTSRNHGDLDALASFLIDEGVPESRFWAFIEFGDIGQAAEHVRFGEAVPNVLAAVERLREAERLVELQWFPKCLLGTHQHLLRNRRDDTLIHEEFTKRSHAHGAFSCPHQERCPAFGQSCLGLHERYVALFGDERQLLTSLA